MVVSGFLYDQPFGDMGVKFNIWITSGDLSGMNIAVIDIPTADYIPKRISAFQDRKMPAIA
jgi:hypothetical protein